MKYWVEGQSSKIGIDAIHCAYTPKTDLYPQVTADIKSYTKFGNPLRLNTEIQFPKGGDDRCH